jgi:predicted PolB exonuclease-like 3'-5' exonuclease
VVCRIVSVAAVERSVSGGNTKLHLLSLPRDVSDAEQVAEKSIVGTFLDKVGQYRPQLVGFNSASADLKAFIQRAVVLGIQAKGFCTRPNKPWEGDDYFDSRNSEASIDIKDVCVRPSASFFSR